MNHASRPIPAPLRAAAVAGALAIAASQFPALAAEYSCVVAKKVDGERQYSPDQLKRFQYSNRIEEVAGEAWVSRCSFAPSQGKVTCDRFKIDHVVVDQTVKIKKFYLFSAQFDLQLYPDLTYVENNGRGGVSYGKCTLTSP
jgi:hypothetical protein